MGEQIQNPQTLSPDALAAAKADQAARDGKWASWAQPGFEDSARSIAQTVPAEQPPGDQLTQGDMQVPHNEEADHPPELIRQ